MSDHVPAEKYVLQNAFLVQGETWRVYQAKHLGGEFFVVVRKEEPPKGQPFQTADEVADWLRGNLPTSELATNFEHLENCWRQSTRNFVGFLDSVERLFEASRPPDPSIYVVQSRFERAL